MVMLDRSGQRLEKRNRDIGPPCPEDNIGDQQRPSEVLPSAGRGTSPSTSRQTASPTRTNSIDVGPAEPEFSIQADLPVIERLRTGRVMTAEEYEAYRRRRDKTPIWVWSVIAAGGALAVILAALMIMG